MIKGLDKLKTEVKLCRRLADCLGVKCGVLSSNPTTWTDVDREMISNKEKIENAMQVLMQQTDASRLPVIDLKDGFGCFCLAFVYPRNKKPCVVKGRATITSDYIRRNFAPCMVNYTLYAHKPSFFWSLEVPFGYDGVYIALPHGPSARAKRCNKFRFFTSHLGEPKFSLRKIPQRWIPEYDKLLTKNGEIVDIWNYR